MAYLDMDGLRALNKRLGTVLVRKDKVANNLTTTASGMVLDARQGKVLSDAVNGKAAMQEAVVTLAAAGWAEATDGFEQTVSLSGVTADNAVIVAAEPDNYRAYAECAVYCTGQSTGKLSFFATDRPQQNLAVNVLILQ